MYELTLELCKTNVDFIKFQILLSNEFHEQHNSYATIQNSIFDKEQWLALFTAVRSAGKEILAMPVDLHALQWLISQKVIRNIEVHSVNLFRGDFWEELTRNPNTCNLFLSISGYLDNEINFILSQYNEAFENIILMYGFQNFPTDPTAINLARISEYQKKFKCPIGYADHSSFTDSWDHLLAMAVTQSSSFIEKHFVLEQGSKRIDYESAIGVNSANETKEKIDYYINTLGSNKNARLNAQELNYRARRLTLTDLELKSGEVGYRWLKNVNNADPLVEFRNYFAAQNRQV